MAKGIFTLSVELQHKRADNYIKLSEAIWILPIIGREWYEELLEQVKTNTLTDANSTALVETSGHILALLFVMRLFL